MTKVHGFTVYGVGVKNFRCLAFGNKVYKRLCIVPSKDLYKLLFKAITRLMIHATSRQKP